MEDEKSQETCISPAEVFDNFIMSRYYLNKNKTKDRGSYFSNIIVTSIANHPEYETQFIQKLARFIPKILASCKPKLFMDQEQIIDNISELSDYATIFVFQKKYDHIYKDICKLLKDIRDMYPTPPMEWEETPKAPKDEFD